MAYSVSSQICIRAGKLQWRVDFAGRCFANGLFICPQLQCVKVSSPHVETKRTVDGFGVGSIYWPSYNEESNSICSVSQ
jgi:hypothetical protein